VKKIKIMVLLISLFITAILTYGIYEYFGRNIDETKEQEFVELIVASRDIEIGSEIKLSDTEIIEIYGEFNIGDYYTKHSEIIGQFTKEKILKGEGFRKERVIENYNNKLVGKIRQGYRAVSIVTDEFDGVADLLKPGDFVDLFVFIPEKTNGDVIIHPDMSKMIVQNVEVLGISKDIEKDTDQREKTPDLYAVTLELDVLDIESVLLAENIGFIKIALRPINDGDIYRTYGTLWEELMIDKNSRMRNIFPVYESLDSWSEGRIKDSGIKDKEGDIEVEDNEIEEKETEDSGQTSENQSTEEIIHVVKYGETLMGISRQYYGSSKKYEEIKKANNLKGNTIVTGQKLKIPVKK
jgi:pilus assembly protein CpaB